jgi:hypothetical protein
VLVRSRPSGLFTQGLLVTNSSLMTEPGAFVRMYAVSGVCKNTVMSLHNSMRTSAEVKFCVSAYLRICDLFSLRICCLVRLALKPPLEGTVVGTVVDAAARANEGLCLTTDVQQNEIPGPSKIRVQVSTSHLSFPLLIDHYPEMSWSIGRRGREGGFESRAVYKSKWMAGQRGRRPTRGVYHSSLFFSSFPTDETCIVMLSLLLYCTYSTISHESSSHTPLSAPFPCSIAFSFTLPCSLPFPLSPGRGTICHQILCDTSSVLYVDPRRYCPTWNQALAHSRPRQGGYGTDPALWVLRQTCYSWHGDR